MALRQVTSEPFPYRESIYVNSVKLFDSRYFEFERDVFLHGLSVFSNLTVGVTVRFSFPVTFTNGGDSNNFITIFSGAVGGSTGVFLAPGAISFGAAAPLPAAFPQGSVLEVFIEYVEENADVEIFLVASA